jgi:hypothetical protein
MMNEYEYALEQLRQSLRSREVLDTTTTTFGDELKTRRGTAPHAPRARARAHAHARTRTR